MSAGQHVIILTTLPDRAAALELAQRLVAKQLAGCVQVLGPILSHYVWRGRPETAEEWLCLVKTRADAYERAAAAIETDHPYDTPEILVLPVVAGSASYLAWLDETVGGSATGGGP